MNRKEQLDQFSAQEAYDMIIIGGGATGLGCAVDAASRGYSTLLLEKFDFAKGTSSRATKLVHGGVRYLAQGNIRLVREALLERGRLLKNAPHVCHTLSFVVPAYSFWRKYYYGIGLWVYEFMSGKLSLGKTSLLNRKKVLELLPDVAHKNLKGGIQYYDGQFDDSRLAINLATTAVEQGATVLNYCGVRGFIQENEKITGVEFNDSIHNKSYQATARVVINATGVFADEVLQMAGGHKEETIAPSQGIHLVVDKKFFKGEAGLMIPKTDDGRVLFAIPWYDKLLLGTTDTPVDNVDTEPKPLKEEVDFILRNFKQYSEADISYKDVKATFAGLRPLAKVKGESKTAVMPRDHVIKVYPNNLVHITGGKWTTYRSMAEHCINKAAEAGKLPGVTCKTKKLAIHGKSTINSDDHFAIYGSDAEKIKALIKANPELGEKLHEDFPYTKAEVVFFIREEMATCIEDVLARRVRLLFLDAKAAIEAAPGVAEIFKTHAGINESLVNNDLEQFNKLAQGYLLHI